VYSFEVTTSIGAPPARVWRALCDPAEVVQWDTGVVEAADAPADYPQPGQHVRWRYRGGLFRVLHDRPQEVVPERILRSDLAVGPFKFYETYRLETERNGCLLKTSMSLWAVVPLVGVIVERFYLGAATKRSVEASMQSLKEHCERSAD
jgi:hypothetical protein